MIYGLSDDELLDCLGPDWSAMSAEERIAYAPAAMRPALRAAMEEEGAEPPPARVLNSRQLAARARRASDHV